MNTPYFLDIYIHTFIANNNPSSPPSPPSSVVQENLWNKINGRHNACKIRLGGDQHRRLDAAAVAAAAALLRAEPVAFAAGSRENVVRLEPVRLADSPLPLPLLADSPLARVVHLEILGLLEEPQALGRSRRRRRRVAAPAAEVRRGRGGGGARRRGGRGRGWERWWRASEVLRGVFSAVVCGSVLSLFFDSLGGEPCLQAQDNREG